MRIEIMRIDLNADLGEGFPFDAQLMPFITSASIACAGHAGDETTIRTALRAAKQYNVRIGAHPGFPDREYFGRRELPFPAERIFHDCTDQIRTLLLLAEKMDASIHYLKPHGALYHMACRNDEHAIPIVQAAAHFKLAVMGLPASALERNVRTEFARHAWSPSAPYIREGFADRRYSPDGDLVPRDQPNAFIDDPDEAAEQVDWLIRRYGVQSICLHGDNPQALDFVRRLRECLIRSGFVIQCN